MTILRQARAAGYFSDPANIQDLKQNPSMQPLRDREDFRELLDQLEPD